MDDDVADGLLSDVRDADMRSLLDEPDMNTALDWLLKSEVDVCYSFNASI